MDTNECTQQIMEDMLALPGDKIAEVVDFVHFPKAQAQTSGHTPHETGLTREEAFDLRRRLATFENDWDAPGMDAYDNL
jgi:hypothetical protein